MRTIQSLLGHIENQWDHTGHLIERTTLSTFPLYIQKLWRKIKLPRNRLWRSTGVLPVRYEHIY
jgi:hypothetical protein